MCQQLELFSEPEVTQDKSGTESYGRNSSSPQKTLGSEALSGTESYAQPPPDLLDECDHFGRQDDHLSRGFGVWSLTSSLSRSRGPEREERYINVIYDSERSVMPHDKTGLHWNVEIAHHFYWTEEISTGWGSSRRKKTKSEYRYRDTTRQFATREQAVAFAEKLVAIFTRLQGENE